MSLMDSYNGFEHRKLAGKGGNPLGRERRSDPENCGREIHY